MVSDEIMLKVENVSKIYKLGEIGGTTLRDELQRLGAKIRKKEDPTKKIGAKNYNKGEKFKALDNISFEVKKGERVGIIGHNGAGKSTLLKLISRVTGPTEGNIYLNGRVASMLEVGTGFHPELTGRENIYMNGAILGMTKKEIDAKMEDIIEFSEVRQFIDTPVKRYSSGMYVKLAFSVAAHLDSEIMIMDEVLAVGDVAFQKKCIQKMKSVSESESRTILYVSHNMRTIKELCDRVIVLNKGTIVFDGSVEEGISTYVGLKKLECFIEFDSSYHRDWRFSDIYIKSLCLSNKNIASFYPGELISGVIKIDSNIDYKNVSFRFEIFNSEDVVIGTSFSSTFNISKGENNISFVFDTKLLAPGKYKFDIVLFTSFEYGSQRGLDGVYPGLFIDIQDDENGNNKLKWRTNYWGNVHFNSIEILD